MYLKWLVEIRDDNFTGVALEAFGAFRQVANGWKLSNVAVQNEL